MALSIFSQYFGQSLRSLVFNRVEDFVDRRFRDDELRDHALVEFEVSEEAVQDFVNEALESVSCLLVLQS